MNSDFNLNDPHYVSVGGSDIGQAVQNFAYKYVGQHAVLALALILVLVIVVLWLVYKQKEGFMPTATMRYQQVSGQLGSIGTPEGLAASSTSSTSGSTDTRDQSYFAQVVQDTTSPNYDPNQFSVDPSAAPGAPGSLGYQILNSSVFDCANAGKPNNNAWGWMAQQAGASSSAEGMQSVPSGPGGLTKILAGR